MIRGKAAIMFDPTKLLPQNQTNVDLIIKQRKEQEENGVSSAEGPSSPSGNGDMSPNSSNGENNGISSPTGTGGGDEQQNLNHFSRPKVAGRRQVRIVQQDSTQRRQQVAMELVGSEKMYHAMLESFAKAFLTPLKENASNFGIQPSNIIAMSETFEQIILFSFNFGNNPQLGTDPVVCFEENFAQIQELYLLYLNKTIHHIFGLLHDLTGNKRFRQHVKHVQHDLGTNIIEHFLIPITRFSIYELLLRKYAQFVEGETQQHLIHLADRIKEKSTEILTLVENLEQSGKILNLQLQLSTGSNVVYLWNPERQLVHEAVAMKSKIDLKDVVNTANPAAGAENKTHGENKRLMLLFNDQLMWTTDQPDMKYKGHVSLVDISVEVFNQPSEDTPGLLVKQASSTSTQISLDGPQGRPTRPNDGKKAHSNDDTSNNKEGWVLIFDDIATRNIWYREIKSLQSQLANLTTDSTLTIPIEVKDEAQGGCCTIM